MTSNNLTNAQSGTQADTFQDYSVSAMQTDGAFADGETPYFFSDWPQRLGYYKQIPELKSAIDAKSRWVIGKGFKSNELTELALSRVTGFGKDSFNSILANLYKVSCINGDAFAEIIRDDDGQLLNLKPLDPGSMVIVANSKGVVIRYEQWSKVKGVMPKKFAPEEIFHLARNRVADEIHGVSIVDAVKEIILMRNEAMADYKKLLHRNIFPVRIWHLDTDIASEVTAFKAKAATAKYEGEDIFIPKGAVETELSAVATNATLNPLPWINQLTQLFYQAVGMPQIIIGGAQEITEASAKIAYLSFEQEVEEEQLQVEEQVLAQLNLEINLEFPASLQNELLTDQSKSETMQASTPEDTAVQGMPVNGVAK